MVLTIPAILVAFTFHEYAHAIVADKLGDKTPRFQGRITLNPIAHIDPIGFIAILVLRFGWAKPVEVNPRAFKNYYMDDLKVSIAGPVANMIVAIIFTPIIGIYVNNVEQFIPNATLAGIISAILYMIVAINVNLFFLNLIPIPGLDGFHVLRDLFPSTFYKYSETIYKYQFVLLIAFVVFGAEVISIPAGFVTKSLLSLAGVY